MDDYVGGIPSVVAQITTFFFGKKYLIHGAAPREDECDYAMELLSPLKMIGISHQNAKIVALHSAQSRQNIVFGSRIIQINDTPVTRHMDNQHIGALLSAAKSITPSSIVCRCAQDGKQKGTHLKFDVTLADGHKGQKFPFYNFTKTALQRVFDVVFAEDGRVELMEVYAATKCGNGEWAHRGVSVLIFIENALKRYRNYELFERIGAIQTALREQVCAHLIVRFDSKLESIKANGLDLHRIMVDLKTKDVLTKYSTFIVPAII